MKRKALILGTALLLASFVSPFSYVPNPLGLYYIVEGDYSYDPDSLFVNRFATFVTDPARAISTKLDRLIGQTGLDPLDPNQPLVAYHVLRATNHSNPWRPWRGSQMGAAEVELLYADGSARTYEIPAYQRTLQPGAGGGFAYTGLDRFFAPHQELPDIPFSDAAASIGLGAPKRLDLPAETQRLGTASPVGWATSDRRDGEDLRWAPDGRSFLLRTYPPDTTVPPPSVQSLWLVPLDGSEPRQIAEGVWSYAWGSDGRHIAYIRPLERNRWELISLDLADNVERKLGEPAGPFLSVVGERVYFFVGTDLSVQRLDGQVPESRTLLRGVSSSAAVNVPLAVSPDGGRVAFRCGSDVCLADLSGESVSRVALDYPRPDVPASPSSVELAWTADGQRLAVIAGTYCRQWDSDPPAVLYVVDRSGRLLHRLAVGPNGTTRQPQWTAYGRFIVVNTFPLGGRRIMAVEVETERVVDLSQPRWDTFASLSPDGTQLLLWNGRGGFWTVPLRVE